MKAISIQQPYAEAIIDGPKRVENRSRRLGLDGRWVWVQASRSFYFAREVWEGGTRDEIRAMWPEAPLDPRHYTYGALLGAMLCGQSYDAQAHPCDVWEFGPVCTPILAVVKLSEPYLCPGRLGLWTPPESVECLARMNLIQPHLLAHLTPHQVTALMVQLAEGL